MRRTLHAAAITLALLAPNAFAQVTYLALEPHPTLEAAELQAATLEGHETTVITEATSVPGFENINFQQHTYRVLVGPLAQDALDTTRVALADLGHESVVTSLPTELRSAYQVQVGAYRSDRLAADARAALEALGEPTFTQVAAPFTFVHAGPYDTRDAAEEAFTRISEAGITSRPALAPLTREHQAILDERAPIKAEAPPPPTTLDDLAALPIPVPTTPEPTPEPDPTPQIAATPKPQPTPEPLALELTPVAVTTPATTIPEPAATSEVTPARTIPQPTVTATLTKDHSEALTRAAKRLGQFAAQVAADVAEHVSVRAEELAAEAAQRQPTYVHVAAGTTAQHFEASLAALDELRVTAAIHEANGTYRAYVGPIASGQANDLRLALRQHGIATFTTDQPTGHITDLPQPAEEAVADAPEEPLESATAATAAPANEEHSTTTEVPVAEADPLEEAADAQAPTAEPAAVEAEPATVEAAAETPDSGEEEAATEATAEAPAERAWKPDAPILTSRAELQPGTYLTARTATNPNDLRDTYEQFKKEHDELAFLHAGDSILLLVGPLGEWEVDETHAELRSSGMAAHATHHPNYEPETTQIAEAVEQATTPNNYLALEPHDDVTLEDLTRQAPDLITVAGQNLLGPIPNDQLVDTAKPLTRLAAITFHAYPAPPTNGTPEEWARHAYTLLDHQQAEAARQAFLEARALDPTHYEALFGLAVTEDQLGNAAAAEFAYQYVMRTHPERFEARFNYALRTHRETGAAAAIQHYQQALTLASEHPDATRADAHAALADALAAAGDHNGAAEHYQSAYELSDDLNHVTARFKAQRAAGQALDLLPELTDLELGTRDVRFTALIADIYAQADQAAYALDAIDRRMRDPLTDAEEVLLLNARAATHATTGNHAQAQADLQAAHTLDPQHAATRHNLGLTLLAQGQADAALPHLQAAVQLGVNDALARLDIAEAAHRAGDQQTAATAAQAAGQLLDGEHRARALLIHAEATQALGQYADSLTSLEELLQTTPNDARLLTMAGTAHYQTGQYARAADRLATAHNLTGDQAINSALINAYLASQRYADAERALRATLAVTPDDADALHKLGWALLHLGQHQAAKTAWTDATALNHTQAQEDLASVFPQ